MKNKYKIILIAAAFISLYILRLVALAELSEISSAKSLI